jgi:hypothetical protein
VRSEQAKINVLRRMALRNAEFHAGSAQTLPLLIGITDEGH